jgi:3-isopropylmalate dehydrogenase
MKTYEIAVVHGDGVGPEVCQATLDVIAAVLGSDTPLKFTEYLAGARHYQETGDAAPAATMQACFKADAILHGSIGLPGICYPDGTEAGPEFQLRLRQKLDLYANIRPIVLRPGITSRLRDATPGQIDYTIIRENSEGLYASRGAGANLRDETSVDMLIMSRKGIERVCQKAFEVARQSNGAPLDGKRRVTCCDKSNVLRGFAFFRRIFDEVAAGFPDVERDYSYVDAITVHMVERPGWYNVIVAENMFGDILSDLGAATTGGMGMAASSEIGDSHGFFQAAHGSAPTIAGQGIANPFGTIISGAYMLRWLGDKHKDGHLSETGTRIEAAVGKVLRDGVHTRDIGGSTSTRDATQAVIEALRGGK